MNREYHYNDILLIPNYSECRSRSDVDISVTLGDHKFRAPFCLANMKTVINEELAIELAKRNYFYIMHRFDIDTIEFMRTMRRDNLYTSISIGVNEESYQLLGDLKDNKMKPDYITIDIAHGHSTNMSDMICRIGEIWKRNRPFLIAGNIATWEAAKHLEGLGVNAVKVGVGPGHACTTKLMTGFSRPQFSAVYDIANHSENYSLGNISGPGLESGVHIPKLSIPVIADGGIEHNGDIAKALVAGATMVMCGHLFAGFEESPGEKIIHDDGRITKQYFGSASEYNKEMKKHIEGRKLDIPYRGSIWNKIQEVEESLKSSVSYAGGTKLNQLRKVKWVVQK